MSKKTGKLTKVEIFYIENNQDKNVDEVAKDLNRTKATVQKYIDSTTDTGHTDTVKSEKADVSELFGHKEDRGVTVMTPAASQLADETRSTRVNISDKHKNAIHIIKEK